MERILSHSKEDQKNWRRRLKQENRLKDRISHLARSYASNKGEHSPPQNNTCSLPDALKRGGPRFKNFSKDLTKSPMIFKRQAKGSAENRIVCDHYNTNVGFGTQSKIIQRMTEQKRDCLFTQLHQRTKRASKANIKDLV